MPDGDDLPGGPDDAKLATLARSARARTGAAEGAAVRDETGRTYAAASVDLRSLSLTALQAAVAAAVSSGSGRLEAAVVVSDAEGWADPDQALLAEVVAGSAYRVRPDGTLPTSRG